MEEFAEIWNSWSHAQHREELAKEVQVLLWNSPPEFQDFVVEKLKETSPTLILLRPPTHSACVAILPNKTLANDVISLLNSDDNSFLMPECLALALLQLEVEHCTHIYRLIGVMHPYALEVSIEGAVFLAKQCFGEEEQRRSKGHLSEICEMFTWTAYKVREKITERGVLPELALEITSRYTKDEIQYVMSIFVNHPAYLRGVNLEYNTTFAKIRSSCIEKIETSPPDDEGILCSRLKLYCGIVGVMQIPITEDELEIIEKLLLALPKISRAYDICLALSLISRGIQQSQRSTRDLHQATSDQSSHQLSEFLLMLKVFFRANCEAQAESLLRQLLGLSVALPLKTIFQIRNLFSKNLSCKDHRLANEALNMDKVGPIYSAVVLQLLNANIIQSSSIDISPWVQRNILSNPLQVDATFLKIIDTYIRGLYTHSFFTPLPLQLVQRLDTVPSTERGIGSNLIILYYYYLMRKLHTMHKSVTTSRLLPPPLIIEQSAIVHLLYLSETLRPCSLVDSIMPHLLGLVMSQHTELFDAGVYHYKNTDETHNLLSSTALKYTIMRSSQFATWDKTQGLVENVFNEQPLNKRTVKKTLEYLMHLDPFRGLKYGELIIEKVLPLVFINDAGVSADTGSSNDLKCAFVRFWTSLYTISPGKVCLSFLNRAARLLNIQNSSQLYTQNMVRARPILVMKVAKIFIVCPELIQILIFIVRYYLIESSNYVYHTNSLKPTAVSQTALKNIETITDLQATCVIQLFLELCSLIPTKAPDLCLFIHQTFIEKSTLIKQVLNQGFLLQLIPMAVDLIPSIHVATDFIPELLHRSDESRKVFLIHLSSHLFKRYPIRKSYFIANDVIMPQIRTLVKPITDYFTKLKSAETTSPSSGRFVFAPTPSVKDVYIAKNVISVLPILAETFPALLVGIAVLISMFNPRKVNPVLIESVSGCNQASAAGDSVHKSRCARASISHNPSTYSYIRENSLLLSNNSTVQQPIFSRQEHLKELQDCVDFAFKEICEKVYCATPEQLDKSIAHRAADLEDLRAYNVFYYGR